MLITHSDGTVHFSDLKQMARSPAHYAYSCANQKEATRDMRIGSYVNKLVLGKAPRRDIVVFDGDARRGKAWDQFYAEHQHAEILTAPEAAEAGPIAEAVIADPVALGLLASARYEVPLSWTDNGIPCSTAGIDIVGAGYLADLKVVHNAEPEYLQKHAIRMMWHAQLAWYLGALASGGAMHYSAQHLDGEPWRPQDLYLLCVESSPPHCVTVLQLSPAVIEAGERCVRSWMERLKVCTDSDVWPGYAMSPVTWELPDWMVDDED